MTSTSSENCCAASASRQRRSCSGRSRVGTITEIAGSEGLSDTRLTIGSRSALAERGRLLTHEQRQTRQLANVHAERGACGGGEIEDAGSGMFRGRTRTRRDQRPGLRQMRAGAAVSSVGAGHVVELR